MIGRRGKSFTGAGPSTPHPGSNVVRAAGWNFIHPFLSADVVRRRPPGPTFAPESRTSPILPPAGSARRAGQRGERRPRPSSIPASRRLWARRLIHRLKDGPHGGRLVDRLSLNVHRPSSQRLSLAADAAPIASNRGRPDQDVSGRSTGGPSIAAIASCGWGRKRGFASQAKDAAADEPPQKSAVQNQP